MTVHLAKIKLKSFDNNCYTLGFLLDLTEAIDKIDHDI